MTDNLSLCITSDKVKRQPETFISISVRGNLQQEEQTKNTASVTERKSRHNVYQLSWNLSLTHTNTQSLSGTQTHTEAVFSRPPRRDKYNYDRTQRPSLAERKTFDVLTADPLVNDCLVHWLIGLVNWLICETYYQTCDRNCTRKSSWKLNKKYK